MEENYAKACTEVLTVLSFLPNKNVHQIPLDTMLFLEENMDKEYKFNIDIDKPFEEQELLDETKAILAILFRDYWANNYQRERILAKEQHDREMMEKEKSIKYNSNDLFKNRNNNKKQENVENIDSNKENVNAITNEQLPTEIKKENIFKRLITYITGFLHI